MENTEYVFIYAAVPKAQFHKVNLPEGAFAKALELKSDEMADKTRCQQVGHIVMQALYRLGNKLNPSPILKELNG